MLTFAYMVGEWVWQDAYVIKKSLIFRIFVLIFVFETALTSEVNSIMQPGGLHSESMNYF